MDVVIGIDASTTGTKAVAFDAQGNERAVGRTAIERQSPQPTWHEQDARSWWSSTIEALQAVQRELSKTSDIVQAVGITHQRESFVCLDTDFEPLRPGILWLDARAGKQVNSLGTPRVHELSGKPPSTTPSFYKLAWLRENEPGTFQRTRKVADVHGYLAYHLTGNFATSMASADPTGLVDLRTGWSDELLSMVGLSRDMMPELIPPGGLIGTVTTAVSEQTGLPPGVPVFAGAGDGQSGGLGVGCSRASSAYLSLGTSITLGAHAADGAPASYDYRILGSPLGSGVTLEALIATGALSVSWFRNAFHGLIADGLEGYEHSLAKTEPGADGLLFLPYLSGSATPYWDDTARGAFIGIDESHTAAHFYRGVLEGLALEIRLLLGRLESATEHIGEVTVTGGGAASAGWLSIIANAINRPLRISSTNEATALGAAILAARGVGMHSGPIDEVANAMVHIKEIVQPDYEDASLYRRLAKSYEQLYPALKPIFHANRPAS